LVRAGRKRTTRSRTPWIRIEREKKKEEYEQERRGGKKRALGSLPFFTKNREQPCDHGRGKKPNRLGVGQEGKERRPMRRCYFFEETNLLLPGEEGEEKNGKERLPRERKSRGERPPIR